MSLNIEGPPGKWTLFYWYDHVEAVAKQVRVVKRKARIEHKQLPQVEAIIEKVGIHVADLVCLDVVPANR